MSGTDWALRGKNWRSHLEALANDSLEGRATGSRGYQRAADYVVEQFQLAGLEPAGSDGFRQSVDFRVAQLDEPGSSLSLIRDGTSVPLVLREDAQIVATSETRADFEADAVFVGYGLEVPEVGYSDLAGLDLRGKFAVYFRGGPSGIPGTIKAHYQSPVERLTALRKAGAIGMVVLFDPSMPDLPWDRLASGLLMPRMELKEPASPESRNLPTWLAFNWARFDRLLSGTGHSAAEIMAGLGKADPLPRFPLAVRIRGHAEVRHSTARCQNLVGVLRGSDPALRNEYVVGSAHLDHIGVGEPIHGDPIYSGAMDNASGVATLIEIARQFKQNGVRGKRSMLFLAVTGEEKGLLGSEYFAQHPSVAGTFVADFNMDMFLPIVPLRYLEVFGFGESSLGADVTEAARSVGVQADDDYEPNRTLFIRSDQYNFVKEGVPSLMLSIGYRKGTPEEARFTEWFHTRYHAPADDLDQPMDLPAAAQFTDLLGRLMRRVADAPERPTWNADSFFRKFVR